MSEREIILGGRRVGNLKILGIIGEGKLFKNWKSDRTVNVRAGRDIAKKLGKSIIQNGEFI